ncbi:unnamed protein product [Phyllotreta striolata]|uniref:Enkurin domain-containing protein n=1 Tax=Phyllotreta striolata TaxID=444603 RepID=A0A9P0DVN8_PHYSR|nr:unnamed protein product [Phyllotreta striolata]
MKNYENNQYSTKPQSTRNFIKENFLNIKSIQRIIRMNKGSKLKLVKGDKFQNVPNWTADYSGDVPPRGEVPTKVEPAKKAVPLKARNTENVTKQRQEEKPKKGAKGGAGAPGAPAGAAGAPAGGGQVFLHRSIQTECTSDTTKLYETGTIKFATSSAKLKNKPPPMEGDSLEAEEYDNKKRDYVKENMSNLKPKPVKPSPVKIHADPPPTYQKGVLPKYLQDKKTENTEDDDQCPPGHVLLPESERKETLRVLRQSYADRIQELNCLPVRSDTLRVRKKKMEIEEELKKIDSGIKVFQRPKVYVKINS